MPNRIRLPKRRAAPVSLAAAVLATLVAHEARAQTGTTVSYGTAGSTYSQNFDGLSTTANTTGLPAAPLVFALGDAQPNGTGATGMAGWYAELASKNTYQVGTGSATTGGLWNFAVAGAQPVTDEALGLITTTTSGQGIFGLELTNTSGSTLTSFTIDYNAETWHTGQAGTSNTLTFGYNLGSTTLPTIDTTGTVNPTTGTYVAVPTLNYTVTGTGSANNPVDGHAAGNNATETTTIIGLSWTAGETLWLTWDFTGAASKAPGIGIDDLTFSATGSSGTAANPVWNATNGVGTWDKVTANWTGGSPTAGLYKDGDNATFNDSHPGTAGGTVTIQAGGVSPGSTTVTTTGTYTFQNTAGDANGIGGTGGVTKNGAGTLILSSQNTYLGGTTVNGGTLQISNDNNLGGSTGALTMDDSTLKTMAAITSARALTFGPDGVTMATLGNNFSTSGATTINGTLTTTGAGVVALNGTVTFGASGSLSIPTGGAVTLGQTGGTITMSDGATINGTLNVAAASRLNFDGTNYEGTGNLNVLSTGFVISNLSSTSGGTLGVNVVLNSTAPTGAGFTKGDVTQATYAPGTFVTTFGGTTAGFGLTVNSVISGYSDVNFANDASGGGTGNLLLGGQSTYQGTTTFNSKSATVQLGVNNALPMTTDVIYGTDGTQTTGAAVFDLNGHNQQIGSLSSIAGGTGTFTITNNGTTTSTLTVSGSTTPANSFAGTLSDGTAPLALVKGGTSTLTLNGTNAYSGSTQITGGTLALGPLGSISTTSSIAISGAATLDASQVAAGLIIGSTQVEKLSGGVGTSAATVKGNVTVDSGSTISPHLSAGSSGELAINGNFGLNAGANLALDLDGKTAGSGYDQLQVSGTLTLGGDLIGTAVGYTPTIGDILDIIIVNGASTTGTLDGVGQDGTITFGAQEFRISYDATTSSFDSTGHDVALMAMTPEPGSAVLLLTGLTVFGKCRWRRRA